MKILVDSTDDRLFLIYQGGLQMMSDVSFILLYIYKLHLFIGLAFIARLKKIECISPKTMIALNLVLRDRALLSTRCCIERCNTQARLSDVIIDDLYF